MSSCSCRATCTILFASDNRYCGSRNSGYAGRLDAMERQPGLIAAEPERRVAAQNVDVVPARRERLPELGRDDAAAADRRITDNADPHSPHISLSPLNSVGRTTGSRTTMPSAQVTPACAPNWASRLSIELSEQRTIKTRADGVWSRLELAGMAIERLALPVVILADVDDEGGRGAVVDEVVANPLDLPRLPVRRRDTASGRC